MENYDTLNKLSESRLKDVVQNFKRYNCSIETRNTAIAILKERGYNEDILNIQGCLDTSNYDRAKSEYESFKLNYKLAILILLMSAFTLSPLSLIVFYLAYRNKVAFYKALGKEGDNDFFADMGAVLMYTHLRNKMSEELKGVR